MILLYLAAGGVLGTLARYGLSGRAYSGSGPGFPWGTLAVNVLGSLLLGYALRAMDFAPVSPELRALVTVGFCGAFTTFSTFSYETVTLMQEGAWARAALYAFGSLGLGMAAMFGRLTLAALLDMSQSAVSHSLRALRELRLVRHRKGEWRTTRSTTTASRGSWTRGFGTSRSSRADRVGIPRRESLGAAWWLNGSYPLRLLGKKSPDHVGGNAPFYCVSAHHGRHCS